MSNRADMWNRKYPVIRKRYIGRTVPKRILGFKRNIGYAIDVRAFLRPDDWDLQDTLTSRIFGASLAGITALDDSQKVQRIQQWVIDNVVYTADSLAWQTDEFWQLAQETIALRYGDCEDGAILIAGLLLNAGVESWRVRVTCGFVDAGEGAAQGGHAYVTYCRGSDWVPVDWCYYPEVASLGNRRPTNARPEYKDVWFSFSDRFCWSHQPIKTFQGRVRATTAQPRKDAS